MAASDEKTPVAAEQVQRSSDFEVDSQDTQVAPSKLKSIKLIDNVRIGLTVLVLCLGITILGVSGDALSVYDSTHLSGDFFLPLWPDEFDLRPTIALCVGSAIVVVANIVALVFGKVKSLRSRSMLHTPITFVAPFAGFAAALIAMIFFYAINASITVDTLQSWSCRWQAVNMTQKPHFSTLCRQSKGGVVLSVILVPLELIVLVVAAYQLKVERAAMRSSSPTSERDRKPSSSPVPS